MSADNVKWRVNRAVRSSNLPAPARLIMLTLSDLADAKTGVIPEKNTPSLKELASFTGLGKATVARQLPELERLGWIICDRPDASGQARHGKTRYRVCVGSGVSERDPAESQGETPEESHSETPKANPESQSETTGVSQRDLAESHSETPYIEDDDLNDHDDLKASATGADGPGAEAPSKPKRKPRKTASPKPAPDPAVAERRRLAEEIVRWWWNGLAIKPAGEKAWFAAVATIEALLKVGWVPQDVASALRAAGQPVTIARLEIELGRHGRRQPAANSNDQHLADEMAWARQQEAEEAARQEAIWEEIPA